MYTDRDHIYDQQKETCPGDRTSMSVDGDCH
uniref:Uncharacterized protein n=1 Tax=Arundo donax TaxID=35708 RepID=A0A0A9A5R3_ARUDO